MDKTDVTLSAIMGMFIALAVLALVATPGKAATTFTITGLVITPSTVGVGSSVTITCTVTNTGAQAGSCVVTLSGDFSQTQSVTLNAGDSATVSFTVTPTIAKTYSVSVDGQSGTFVATSPTPGVYTCPICGDTFATYDELYQHFITAHPSTPITITWT